MSTSPAALTLMLVGGVGLGLAIGSLPPSHKEPSWTKDARLLRAMTGNYVMSRCLDWPSRQRITITPDALDRDMSALQTLLLVEIFMDRADTATLSKSDRDLLLRNVVTTTDERCMS